MGRRLELAGQRFGRLKVVSLSEMKKGESIWLCKCDCGKEKPISNENLKSGRTKSCGCLRIDNMTTHGLSTSPEYKIWQGMIRRCFDTKYIKYHYYGGRGITVCKEWLIFENFYKDMGKRPSGLTLERNDTNGDYCPENCRWATRKDQSLNKNIRINKTSRFRGVCFDKSRGKWKAALSTDNGTTKYLGRFQNELDAAEKATEAYYNYHGKFPPEFKPVPIPERLKCI